MYNKTTLLLTKHDSTAALGKFKTGKTLIPDFIFKNRIVPSSEQNTTYLIQQLKFTIGDPTKK